MPKVYIINKGAHDFCAAEKYGELYYLSQGVADPYKISSFYRKFSHVLADSNKDDMLLISGLTSMNIVASAIMARKHGVVNWLQWHPVLGEYKKRTIIIDNLIGAVEQPKKEM